jgi:hypothetical protein
MQQKYSTDNRIPYEKVVLFSNTRYKYLSIIQYEDKILFGKAFEENDNAILSNQNLTF